MRVGSVYQDKYAVTAMLQEEVRKLQSRPLRGKNSPTWPSLPKPSKCDPMGTDRPGFIDVVAARLLSTHDLASTIDRFGIIDNFACG